MKLKINKYTWGIKIKTNDEIAIKHSGEAHPNSLYFGLCTYDDFEILITKEINPQKLLHSIIHELVHAYIFSHNQACSSECDYCNVFAYFGKEILADATKVNNYIRKELGWDK